MAKKRAEKPKAVVLSEITPSFKINRKFKLRPKQSEFIKTANLPESKVLFIDGLWGTGKTSMAIYYGLEGIKAGIYDSIIYLRNPVEASNVSRLGYLKGDKDEKMSPYGSPGWDLLYEFLGGSTADFIKAGNFEVEAVSFIRGLNWERKLVIVDEAENLSKEDILLVLSRVKNDSKIIFVGDSFQTDIRNSGFRKIFEMFSSEEDKENGIFTFEFRDNDDIVRSDLLKYIMYKVMS